MDYEKKYKEALKVAQKLYQDCPNGKNDRLYHTTDLEKMFPELRESEDERIRKELIEYVKDQQSSFISAPDCRDKYEEEENNKYNAWIAWLEKQKTKKNEWLFEKGKWYVKLQHHYEGDLRHFEKGHVYQALSEVEITDGYHNVSLGSWEIPEYFRPATKDEIPEEAKQTSRLDEDEEIRNYFINAVKEQPNIHQEWKEKCLNWLEKQGEQKPTIEMITPEESLGIDSDTYNKIVDECVYGEQKPADKVEPKQEELTEFEKAVKQVMEEAIECGDTHNLKADADMLLRLVQKPAWSEEDENNIDTIISVYHPSPKIVNWLKSLKQRYTWKPSDEQMKALDSVIDEYDGYPEFDSLVSLKNDLSKL